MTRTHLIATTGLAAVLAVAGRAEALPQTPVITGTNGPGPGATFSSTLNSLTVTQTNTRVVINWNSFNIASGETVTYAQPSNTSIALNIVNASSFTTIDGALNANGGVWIFSPAGVLIGNGAAVNVGSLLISTAIADGTTTGDFLCDCGGSIPFQPQPVSATPSITVQSGATINADAGFVDLNSPTIVQDGNVTASDSVSYSALPGGEVDFDQSSSGLQLKDFFKTPAPTQNQATSITSTGNTTAGQIVAMVTFNDPSLGPPVSSVINLSGHVAANGILSDNSTGTAYGVLLITDDTAAGIRSGAFQVGAGSTTQINASGSVITAAAGRIGAEAGTITTGDWTTSNDLGGTGLNIEAGAGGLNIPGTLDFGGAGQATLSSLGPVNISGVIDSGEAGGLSLTGASINLTGSIAMSHGFFSLTTPGALTISGDITLDPEGGSLVESGSSPVVLSGSFGAGGDLGQNVSLTFTGAPDSGQSLTIGGTPYSLIFDQAELLNVNNNLAGHYALARPLDLTGTIFGGAPIASLANTPFTGTFTGLGNAISNLTIVDQNQVSQNALGTPNTGVVGLFGAVGAGGKLEDVVLANADVQGPDGSIVGALVGSLDGSVINSSSAGQVSTGSINANGFAVAGGLVGESAGSITDSSSSANVTGANAQVGGLLGSAVPGATIAGSFATGDVATGASASPQVAAAAGGLVGTIGPGPGSPTTITDSYATGAVSGGAGSTVGGFVGIATNADISASYATGAVSQTAGGNNLYSDFIGGFAGVAFTGAAISDSYSDGSVQGVADAGFETIAGGFIGQLQQGATISQSYSLTPVTITGSNLSVEGGFAGLIISGAAVDHVYATGALSGFGGIGGLVGNLNAGTITDGYWDEGTTGTATAVSSNQGGTATALTGIGGGTGLSPYDPATYANLDLNNTWFMLPGGTRPMLRTEYSTTITNAHQLQLMAMNLSANYTIVGNIDASETSSASGVWNPATGFVPVGAGSASPFTGSLDGEGHAISNLTIIDTTAANQVVSGFPTNGFVGLFGLTARGSLVENLQITNANVTGGDGMETGILAGGLEGSAYNVSTSGSVIVGNGVTTPLGAASAIGGGLVGGFNGFAINDSSSADVTGGAALVGGLIGATGADPNLPSGVIFESHASGDVTVGGSQTNVVAAAGGFIGLLDGFQVGNVNPKPISISNSYATGNVTGGGGSIIGGFAGSVEQGSITGSYATGTVTQTAGGQNGHASFAGGFAGAITQSSIVDKSWAGGAVTTVGGPANNLFTFAGGFVGDIDNAFIEKDYSLGSVTATGSTFSSIGGFTGVIANAGQEDQTYATGSVTGPGLVGGLAGFVTNAGTVLSNSYWDEGTTGQTSAVGGNNGATLNNVVGIGGSTGLSPYQQATYAAFNFSNKPDDGGWVIIPGETRPMLASEFSLDITDSHQLELMNLDPSGHFTLAADINASDTSNAAGIWNPANGFVPVGGNGLPAFTGTFDGLDHTISNLTIIDTTAFDQNAGVRTLGVVGLFGFANGATLENVDLANVSVTAGDGMRAGALVGSLTNGGSVVNVASSGTVTIGGTVNVGSATIVTGAGGLAGVVSGGSISNSHSSAAVSSAGDAYGGGLVGTLNGTITDSFATGAISVGSFNGLNIGAAPLAGGLAGLVTGSATTIVGSYATGPVTGGGGSRVGGFAGAIQAGATVSDSYATGNVSQTAGAANGATDFAGGFVGINLGATITQSFSSGDVSSVGGPTAALATGVGGFIGDNEGTITNAYATGSVSSSGAGTFALVGGFAGLDDAGGSISQVYATGLVSGVGTLAGLVGQVGNAAQPPNNTGGQVSDSYWDEGTTGQTTGFTLSGTGSIGANVTGIGGSTGISPFSQATYVGWDFNNVWAPPSAGFRPQLFGASHVLRISGGVTTFVYGGYTAVTYTELGLQGGDAASVVTGLVATIPATTATSGYYNAGGYGVTFSSAAATGPSGAYRILYAPGTLTITPRPLSASLVGSVERTYDGTTSATLAAGNYQLGGGGGVVAGDVVGLNDPANGTYASKDVGNGITVTVTGIALTGADAGNYTVNGTASAAVGVIDPKALTATLTGSVSKTFDGSTNATLGAGNYQLSGGVIAGDNVALNDPANGSYATASPGTGIVVTVNGIALTGPDAGDYTVNATAFAPIGTITSAPSPIQVQIITTPSGSGLTQLGGAAGTSTATVGSSLDTGSSAGTGTTTVGAPAGGGSGTATVSAPTTNPTPGGSQTASGGQPAGGQAGGTQVAAGQTGATQAAVTGASDAAGAAETAPAAGPSGQVGVFPVARTEANKTGGAGDNSGVTGAGNGDLWKGADLGGGAGR